MDSWQKKHQLLSLLNQQGFVSGEWLSEQMGMTRAAVNKKVKQLNQEGLEVYSVKGKGYKLADQVSLSQPAELEKLLSRPLHWFHQIESTNAYLMERCHELVKGETCIAECQTAGRGRRGRQWISPYGSNLYQSVYWRIDDGFAAAMGLSLVVGLSLAETLEKLGFDGIGLKWPNDIYRFGRKLAGVLVEIKGSPEGPCHLVIGFGVNIAMPKALGAAIDQPWADLTQESSAVIAKNQLIHALHENLLKDLAQFELSGLEPFLPRWEALDLFIGQQVTLTSAAKVITGRYLGVDSEGNLLLEDTSGERNSYSGGEVSLRLLAE
ncbi:bifunctional biotin--[acetyl-CoA-carboxylase] ligase/biotin operon repressor BirA [Paraferrimonas sedimenticola]|uniref:Bifunctional ligase/repressor BirA n=1 Tax=Paraferrimonas sedimenticola TaxID=375674 RepID=A0AA37RXW9_9GAMM|nr:bifunctional biotin--[acetyl-CoA-carboxylase] ligase/biotin operon repressor BirA [Paraferrimonas sedimenticola]GLP97760.1 bifunctional ligase/repressor BirA [Paraferrimonas sedimenticola]